MNDKYISVWAYSLLLPYVIRTNTFYKKSLDSPSGCGFVACCVVQLRGALSPFRSTTSRLSDLLMTWA